jgi:hypothetical protein
MHRGESIYSLWKTALFPVEKLWKKNSQEANIFYQTSPHLKKWASKLPAHY